MRAWTFDKIQGLEEKTVDGKKVKEHEGEAILLLAKHKVHVCWYEGDGALLLRRAEVWANRGRGEYLGRPALGRNGLGKEYTPKPIANESTVPSLCAKECDEWNQELSFFGRRLGHNYQTTDPALEYYRLEMKNNCDK